MKEDCEEWLDRCMVYVYTTDIAVQSKCCIAFCLYNYTGYFVCIIMQANVFI